MRFSTAKFKKNAKGLRKQVPDSHLEVLDGKEVIGGEIKYLVDGEDWYLFPVLPEWCKEQ